MNANEQEREGPQGIRVGTTDPDVVLLARVARQHGFRLVRDTGEPKDALRLTPKQAEVLRALREHGSDKVAADALHIAPSTVKWHVGRICTALGVPHRGAAICRACREGWLDG